MLFTGGPYAFSTHSGIIARLAADGNDARYRVDVTPYARLKLKVNDPTLVSPTRMQMSATEQSVPRSNVAARSNRRSAGQDRDHRVSGVSSSKAGT